MVNNKKLACPNRNIDQPLSIKSAVSLFSGCGGADLGLVGGFTFLEKFYPENNIRITHASDKDKKAVATYNANFKKSSVCEDIANVDFKHLFNDGSPDIIVGGFPCQAFSTVNPTKEPHKKESQLFWEMARAINECNPKIFLAENVKGFYTLNKGLYFKLAIKEFARCEYKIYHKILNASDFGVPQKRERLFIVGIRNDINESFRFPSPTHSDSENDLPKKTTLRNVIADIWPSDEKYFFSRRAVLGVKKAKPNMKRALAQDLDSQCLTILSHLAKVSLNSRDPVLLVDPDRELYRRFTPSEAAAIQSFPATFKFEGSEGDAYRQIGNAVPPVLMWHLTQSVLAIV